MYSFILIADSALDNEIYQCFQSLGSVKRQYADGLYVKYDDNWQNGWISYLPTTNLMQDYEKCEVANIKRIFTAPIFHLFEVKDGLIKVSNQFILNFTNTKSILIDNDHGSIASMQIYKQRIINEEEWKYNDDIYSRSQINEVQGNRV